MIFGKNILQKWLQQHDTGFHSIVPFDDEKEKIIALDFTENNKALQKIYVTDTKIFCQYINEVLQNANAKFGVGGYDEIRCMYASSKLFGNDKNDEPRRLHIGFDIWGKAGTEVFAPCNATVHSFAFNDHFGDYGATIILQHHFGEIIFYTLYGHVSLADLQNLKEGNEMQAGQVFAHFGEANENGHWPPHLHFQLIHKIDNYKGDYPGVCKFNEREKYLNNCPDPDLILRLNRYV